MNGRKQKTTVASGKDLEKNRSWHLVDTDQRILGRMATRVATVLMGKHKPTYTSFLDTGDFVIVINAEKIRLSGKKWDTKVYDHYTGYPSGRKITTAREMMEKKPAEMVRLAVKRMLPQTKLGRHMFMKLKVYAGPIHAHQAQNPTAIQFTGK